MSTAQYFECDMCYTKFDTQENLSMHHEYAKYRSRDLLAVIIV